MNVKNNIILGVAVVVITTSLLSCKSSPATLKDNNSNNNTATTEVTGTSITTSNYSENLKEYDNGAYKFKYNENYIDIENLDDDALKINSIDNIFKIIINNKSLEQKMTKKELLTYLKNNVPNDNETYITKPEVTKYNELMLGTVELATNTEYKTEMVYANESNMITVDFTIQNKEYSEDIEMAIKNCLQSLDFYIFE